MSGARPVVVPFTGSGETEQRARGARLRVFELAVVVDDAGQGVTDVVRGADLLDSTPRQIYLQRRLGHATPRYLHVPAAVNIYLDLLNLFLAIISLLGGRRRN